MAAPTNDIFKHRFALNILFLAMLFYNYFEISALEDQFLDFLLCRQCGHEVVTGEHFLNIPSAEAKHSRNATILGRNGTLIQLFRNPQGNEFEVITTRKADVLKKDHPFTAFTWFPGFLWRVAVCPRCGTHLGWWYEPTDELKASDDTAVEKSFWGLILANLLHEDFADSLLITPKSYFS